MRSWTVSEALDRLPRLRHLVEVVPNGTTLAAESRRDGHGPPPGEDRRAALTERKAGDIIVRDPKGSDR